MVLSERKLVLEQENDHALRHGLAVPMAAGPTRERGMGRLSPAFLILGSTPTLPPWRSLTWHSSRLQCLHDSCWRYTSVRVLGAGSNWTVIDNSNVISPVRPHKLAPSYIGPNATAGLSTPNRRTPATASNSPVCFDFKEIRAGDHGLSYHDNANIRGHTLALSF